MPAIPAYPRFFGTISAATATPGGHVGPQPPTVVGAQHADDRHPVRPATTLRTHLRTLARAAVRRQADDRRGYVSPGDLRPPAAGDPGRRRRHPRAAPVPGGLDGRARHGAVAAGVAAPRAHRRPGRRRRVARRARRRARPRRHGPAAVDRSRLLGRRPHPGRLRARPDGRPPRGRPRARARRCSTGRPPAGATPGWTCSGSTAGPPTPSCAPTTSGTGSGRSGSGTSPTSRARCWRLSLR